MESSGILLTSTSNIEKNKFEYRKNYKVWDKCHEFTPSACVIIFFVPGARWGPSHKRKYLLRPRILFSVRVYGRF